MKRETFAALADSRKAEVLRNTLAVLQATGVAKRYPKEIRKLRRWLARYELVSRKTT